jgi:hypothetical protein
MKRVLLIILATLAVAALSGAAKAAPLTACNMVKASEYAKVLGKAVKMSPGEGASSCNVFVGPAPVSASLYIIPNLTPYSPAVAASMKTNYASWAKQGLKKYPALGPMGAVWELSAPGGSKQVMTYFQKGKWFVSFQGMKGVTKAQMVALAALVYRRL